MAKPEITKETLEYLAQLARIRLDPQEEGKLLEDIQEILAYVSELQEVDTDGITPMNGGTLLTDIFREDGTPDNPDDKAPMGTHRGAGTEQFPATKDGFLKIPPVFGGDAGSSSSQ